MVNPIAVAGCLAIGFGGLAYAFVGGDEPQASRLSPEAVRKALNVSANVDRAARKKQIADGLRDIERKGKQRVSLATRSTRPEPVKLNFARSSKHSRSA